MCFIAKSDKTTLINHSNSVKYAALKMLMDNANYDVYNKFEKIITIASLLHDIGKCTEQFQNFLETGNIVDFNFYHNQIGASFLTKHLINLTEEEKKTIINIIYWHHGVFELSTYDEIYNSLTEKDISNMSSYLKSTLGEEFLSENPIYDDNFINPSTYFKTGDESGKNVNLIMLRSFVIGGDRLVSKIQKNEITNERINNDIATSLNKTTISKINPDIFNNSERLSKQNEIISECGKTTIINAPAGFGKTIMGLLWGFKNDKKIIWVCPRNFVAESVYESIINELKRLNLNDINVELFLTNEVKKNNYDLNFKDGFTSDIIVTNIDSFLFTSISNSKLNYLYLTNDVNVIFDEYHELVTDTGIMSLFVNIMKIRHQILNSQTLLLSATYLPVNEFWDCDDIKTKILPSKYQHYKAVHDKQYQLNIVNEPNIAYNSLTILNSISLAQEYKIKTNAKHLIHSKFEQEDRKNQVNMLLGLYGKDSIRNINKNFVIGTHIVQASLDVSFNDLNESILSPESTMQRIGRCDRWGDYQNESKINIFTPPDSSEAYVIDNLYDTKLNKLWFETIKKYNGKALTLNELYIVYNNFSSENEKDIQKFIRKKYNKSINNISNVYPVKYKNTNNEFEYYTTKANKLRCSDNDLFVIYEKEDGTFTDVFNERTYYNVSKEFGENENTLSFMKKTMVNLDDERYDYSYIKNKKTKKQRDKITIDDLRKESKKSNSPYIRFDCKYIKDFGVIKTKLLKKYNIN